VNTSILQTMTRSVNTLATVVVTLVALLAFGGASLQNFAFALLVGICSGGYHSIFYSAPLVAVMRQRQLRDASKRRALEKAGLSERPRTVAEARAQASATASREAILAARRERRDKKPVAGRPTGPARYKRKRTESSATSLDDGYYEEEYVGGEELDPLDAQNAGFHESDLELGHEEIHLNLEDEAEPHEHAPLASDEHGTTAAKHD
jgi:hypothetical protein